MPSLEVRDVKVAFVAVHMDLAIHVVRLEGPLRDTSDDST